MASDKGVELLIVGPQPGDYIESPLIISGEAPGNWFFEATAPVVIVDWDGRIIGEGYIDAQDEWMTEEMVQFLGSVSYELPEDSYSSSGTVIFKRANASGLPEHDTTVEIPVVLQK